MPLHIRLAAALLGAALCTAPITAKASVLVTVDKVAQRMTVTVDGEKRWTWPVSTGRKGYATPAGTFTPFRMAEDHYSKEWDEAPMPYSIFFTEGGHAIHGSYQTRQLGRAASHGCVRLSPKNAATLFALVQRRGLSNITVAVTDGGPAAPVVAKRPAPVTPVTSVTSGPMAAPLELQAQKAPPAPMTAAEQAYGYAPPVAAPIEAAPPLQPAAQPPY